MPVDSLQSNVYSINALGLTEVLTKNTQISKMLLGENNTVVEKSSLQTPNNKSFKFVHRHRPQATEAYSGLPKKINGFQYILSEDLLWGPYQIFPANSFKLNKLPHALHRATASQARTAYAPASRGEHLKQ